MRRLPEARATLINLLEIEPTPEALLGRWRQAGTVPKLSGPIGVAEDGVARASTWSPTARTALVAGTTGVGQERAAAHASSPGWPPTRRPRRTSRSCSSTSRAAAPSTECARLPHTVGLVTDLDEHLGRAGAALPRGRAAPPGAAAARRRRQRPGRLRRTPASRASRCPASSS